MIGKVKISCDISIVSGVIFCVISLYYSAPVFAERAVLTVLQEQSLAAKQNKNALGNLKRVIIEKKEGPKQTPEIKEEADEIFITVAGVEPKKPVGIVEDMRVDMRVIDIKGRNFDITLKLFEKEFAALHEAGMVENFCKYLMTLYDNALTYADTLLPTGKTLERFSFNVELFGSSAATGESYADVGDDRCTLMYGNRVIPQYSQKHMLSVTGASQLVHEFGHILFNKLFGNIPEILPHDMAIEEGFGNHLSDVVLKNFNLERSLDFRHEAPQTKIERLQGLCQFDLEAYVWGADDVLLRSNNMYFGRLHHVFGDYFIDAFIRTYSKERLIPFLYELQAQTKIGERLSMNSSLHGAGTKIVKEVLLYSSSFGNKTLFEEFQNNLYESINAHVFKPSRMGENDLRALSRSLASQIGMKIEERIKGLKPLIPQEEQARRLRIPRHVLADVCTFLLRRSQNKVTIKEECITAFSVNVFSKIRKETSATEVILSHMRERYTDFTYEVDEYGFHVVDKNPPMFNGLSSCNLSREQGLFFKAA